MVTVVGQFKISRKSTPLRKKDTVQNWDWHIPNRGTVTHPGKS